MSRALAFLGAGLTLLAAPVPAPAELANSPWPMFGHDLRHTGRSTKNGPSSSNVRAAWTYKAPGQFKVQPPTIGPDGTIYLAAGLLPYCAVNPNGTKKWCTSGLGGSVSNSAATVGVDPVSPATGAVIYVGGRDNKTWAIKDNGQNSFTIQWRKKIEADGDVHASPLIDPETAAVYSACGCVSAGQLEALDPTPADMTDGPGELLWPSALIKNTVHYISPAQDDRGDASSNPHYRRVYIGSTDGKLHALTPDDVGNRWKAEWTFLPASRATNNYSSPIIGDDGTIYMGSYLGLSAITDLGTSARNKWPVFRGGRSDSTPALSLDGSTVYFGKTTSPFTFYAINTATGTEKWRYPPVGGTALPGALYTPPAIGANGIIYVGARKVVYAFRDDGDHASLVWSFATGGVVQGIAIGDGVLYVTSNDQKLYRIEDVGP